jgi:hypothetical protein
MTKRVDRGLNPDQQRFHVKRSEPSCDDPRGDWVGMTAAQRWQLEKTALERLNELDPDHWNTPELISTDPEALTLTTRWAGWNLNECQSRGITPQYSDLDRDRAQIVTLLARAQITLLDRDRENLLWNPVTYRLVITDFDSAVITDLPLTDQQRRRLAETSQTLDLSEWIAKETQR